MRLSTILGSILMILAITTVCLAQPATPASSGGNGGAAETAYSNVRRDNLLNGLQIVTLEQPTESTIKCLIVIRTGSMFDSVGKSGLVALTQRTLLAVNPQLREEMDSLQTKIDWGVDRDKTWFRMEMPPANFEAALEILGRLLVVETIRTDAFKRAQTEQLELIRQGIALPGSAQRADDAFHQTLFGDYPYGRNVIGTELTVANLRQGDVYDIFQRFYLANNSAVILAGKIAPEKALRAFKYLFGGWSKGSIVPATFRQPAQVSELKLVRLDASGSERVEIRGGLTGVRYASPEFLLTQLMVEILTRRWASEAGGQSARVEFEAARQALPGPLYFSAQVAPAEAEALSQRVTAIFSGLSTNPVTADELTAARTSLLTKLSARPVEEWLFDIEAFGLPRNYPLTLRNRLESTTTTELQALIRKLFEGNALTVVVLGGSASAAK